MMACRAISTWCGGQVEHGPRLQHVREEAVGVVGHQRADDGLQAADVGHDELAPDRDRLLEAGAPSRRPRSRRRRGIAAARTRSAARIGGTARRLGQCRHP
jgi:hypothetical protein